MSATVVESRPSSSRRLWGLAALIFIVQLGLIFWLGHTAPIRPRPAARAFTLKLAGSASEELLTLNDPTLFALPRRQGPAGPAVQRTPRLESHSLQWPEPTNSLLMAVGRLGAGFSQFIETNAFDSPQLSANLQPALTLPNLAPLALSTERSTYLLEWISAPRRLITQLSLPSWPNPDILADSIVRIAVDSEGRPVSPTLLSSSGATAPDQCALKQAREARFEPVRRNPADPVLKPAPDLSLVRMIFRWHTLPPLSTNAPAVSP